MARMGDEGGEGAALRGPRGKGREDWKRVWQSGQGQVRTLVGEATGAVWALVSEVMGRSRLRCLVQKTYQGSAI